MSAESEIWGETLALLKERFQNRTTTYNLWFSELVLQKLIDDKAYLQINNTYKKKILEEKFMDDLRQALCDTMGFDVEPFIISIETRPFDEQYFELIENDARKMLIEEQKKKGINYEPDYTRPDENELEKEPELIEPRKRRGKFKLSKKNLILPKVYNAENDKLEDLSLVKYLEFLGNTDGMLHMSRSAPDYQPGYTFENFVVGDSNRMAFATSYAVAQYPGVHCNPLFIYGPTGLGKTHLLYAIANHIGKNFPSFNIVYCTSEDFTNELISAITHKTQEQFREKYRTADVLMIDDIQFIGGKEATQMEFFNTFNTLYDSNKQIIVASDRPPKDIEVLEKRIRSRFESSAIIDIKAPDPELREAIIRRKAMDMNINIPNTAINYISQNVTENVRQIEGIMKHLGIYAVLKKEAITEDLIRSIVGNVATEKVSVNPENIIQTVSRHTNVSRDDILGKKHTKNVVMARHITSYLLRTLTDLTFQEIGVVIGRHHSTVHDSVRYIEKEIKEDKALEERIKAISKEIQ